MILRQLTAWLLIFSVLTVNYSRLFVYAGFKLNQSYISAKLCENRNRPLLHCNGKCYLMKKIRAAEEKENNAEAQAQKNLFQDVCLISYTPGSASPVHTVIAEKFPAARNAGGLPDAHLSIFRPPQLG